MKPKVIVVDDERLTADTLVSILNHAGCEAVAAYDGLDAIELAHVMQPDVVISDVIHPGINGIEMAIRIREFLPKCKILLLSGHAKDLGELMESARLRGHDFVLLVSKPVQVQYLVDWAKGADESQLRKLEVFPLIQRKT